MAVACNIITRFFGVLFETMKQRGMIVSSVLGSVRRAKHPTLVASRRMNEWSPALIKRSRIGQGGRQTSINASGWRRGWGLMQARERYATCYVCRQQSCSGAGVRGSLTPSAWLRPVHVPAGMPRLVMCIYILFFRCTLS